MAGAHIAPPATKLKLDPHQVVLLPLVTEKNTHLAERRNTFAFKVHPQATKMAIKTAVEMLFEVRVEQVRTLVRKGKKVRFKNRKGQHQDYKRAYVTLHEDDRIAMF